MYRFVVIIFLWGIYYKVFIFGGGGVLFGKNNWGWFVLIRMEFYFFISCIFYSFNIYLNKFIIFYLKLYIFLVLVIFMY